MISGARTEGEILFFSGDDTLRQTLAVLCGVSGEAVSGVRPRLCIVDEDGPSRKRCMEVAGKYRAAVLLLGDAPPDAPAKGIYHLPRPFLFSEFTDLLRGILSDTEKTAEAATSAGADRIILTRDGWLCCGERRCHLSPMEEQILRLLLQAAPAPVSRKQIAQIFVSRRGNGVDVYISYLRRKLGELTPQVGILSVRGRGYALVGGEIVQN